MNETLVEKLSRGGHRDTVLWPFLKKEADSFNVILSKKQPEERHFPMSTIPQYQQLLNQLVSLLQAHRSLFRQERVFQRVALLVIAELVVFARHTITQLLMGVGLTQAHWSGWYRLFSQGRFPYDEACAVMVAETVKIMEPEALHVVAGDGMQTRRSTRKIEGAHWLHNPQSPVFSLTVLTARRSTNAAYTRPYSHRRCVSSSTACSLYSNGPMSSLGQNAGSQSTRRQNPPIARLCTPTPAWAMSPM